MDFGQGNIWVLDINTALQSLFLVCFIIKTTLHCCDYVCVVWLASYYFELVWSEWFVVLWIV